MTILVLIQQCFDIIKMWMQSLWNPLNIIQRLIESSEEEVLTEIAKLWTPPILLSMIINYPILNLFGIRWDNVGFYAPEELFTVVSLMSAVVVIHFLLRLFGITSLMSRTAGLYTIVVIYSPITTLMAIPIAYDAYGYTKTLKEQASSDPVEALKALFVHEYFGIEVKSLTPTNIVSYLTGFVGLITFTVFTECVARYYNANRYKTYVAVGIGAFLISYQYRVFVVPMHSLIAYAFM